jgi:hypothetical protein
VALGMSLYPSYPYDSLPLLTSPYKGEEYYRR